MEQPVFANIRSYLYAQEPCPHKALLARRLDEIRAVEADSRYSDAQVLDQLVHLNYLPPLPEVPVFQAGRFARIFGSSKEQNIGDYRVLRLAVTDPIIKDYYPLWRHGSIHSHWFISRLLGVFQEGENYFLVADSLSHPVDPQTAITHYPDLPRPLAGAEQEVRRKLFELYYELEFLKWQNRFHIGFNDQKDKCSEYFWDTNSQSKLSAVSGHIRGKLIRWSHAFWMPDKEAREVFVQTKLELLLSEAKKWLREDQWQKLMELKGEGAVVLSEWLERLTEHELFYNIHMYVYAEYPWHSSVEQKQIEKALVAKAPDIQWTGLPMDVGYVSEVLATLGFTHLLVADPGLLNNHKRTGVSEELFRQHAQEEFVPGSTTQGFSRCLFDWNDQMAVYLLRNPQSAKQEVNQKWRQWLDMLVTIMGGKIRTGSLFALVPHLKKIHRVKDDDYQYDGFAASCQPLRNMETYLTEQAHLEESERLILAKKIMFQLLNGLKEILRAGGIFDKELSLEDFGLAKDEEMNVKLIALEALRFRGDISSSGVAASSSKRLRLSGESEEEDGEVEGDYMSILQRIAAQLGERLMLPQLQDVPMEDLEPVPNNVKEQRFSEWLAAVQVVKKSA